MEHVEPFEYDVRRFINLFTTIFNNEDGAYEQYAKVFGVDMELENIKAILEDLYIKSLAEVTEDDEGKILWDEKFIQELIKKQPFKVAQSYDEFEFIGGHRVGSLWDTTYDEIVSKFGPPTSAIPSGDNKVQAEWDIQFENGSRASIYDYKQYDIPYEEVTDWSVGGNTPQDAFEVYKIMDLI